MTDIYDIADKMDYGKGKEAEVLGMPFDVYRIRSSSWGDFISPSNKIGSNVLVAFKPASRIVRESMETEKIPGLMWYEIKADLSGYAVGDVFVLTDPVYQAGYTAVSFDTEQLNAFCLAQHSPAKPIVGARLTRMVGIRRQITHSLDGHFQPDSSKSAALLLKQGRFVLGEVTDTPAMIPVGLIATGRPYGDRLYSDVPSVNRTSGWVVYVPPLPGFQFREGDRIITDDDARFVISVPFTQETGAVGAQLFAERQVGQRG